MPDLYTIVSTSLNVGLSFAFGLSLYGWYKNKASTQDEVNAVAKARDKEFELLKNKLAKAIEEKHSTEIVLTKDPEYEKKLKLLSSQNETLSSQIVYLEAERVKLSKTVELQNPNVVTSDKKALKATMEHNEILVDQINILEKDLEEKRQQIRIFSEKEATSRSSEKELNAANSRLTSELLVATSTLDQVKKELEANKVSIKLLNDVSKNEIAIKKLQEEKEALQRKLNSADKGQLKLLQAERDQIETEVSERYKVSIIEHENRFKQKVSSIEEEKELKIAELQTTVNDLRQSQTEQLIRMQAEQTANAANLRLTLMAALETEHKAELEALHDSYVQKMKNAKERGRAVNFGLFAQKSIMPLTSAESMGINQKDIHWTGGTMDFIVYAGLEDNEDEISIFFLDAKTGANVNEVMASKDKWNTNKGCNPGYSLLAKKQQKIMEAVCAGRVYCGVMMANVETGETDIEVYSSFRPNPFFLAPGKRKLYKINPTS